MIEKAIPLSEWMQWERLGAGICAGVSGMEAACYGSLQGGAQSIGKAFIWIREAYTSHMYVVQKVFDAMNGAFILAYARWFALGMHTAVPITASVGMAPSVLLAVAAAYAVGLGLSRICAPAIRPKETIDGITYSEERASNKLLATKLVLNFAAAFFTKNSLFCLLALASSSYSFYQLSQMKWMTVECDVDAHPNKAHYKILQAPFKGFAQEDCVTCMDPLPDTVFDLQHAFHRHCIGQHISAQLKTGLREWDRYSDTLKKEHWPNCPCCRNVPPQNALRHISWYGRESDMQTLEASDKGFEDVHTAYSTMQAGLAFLQQCPDLAYTIYRIQYLLLIPDAIFLIGSFIILIGRINQKFGAASFKGRIAHASVVSLLVIPILAIRKINQLLKSALDLKALASECNISGKVEWVHAYLCQYLYGTRALFSLAHACFSKMRVQNLWNAACQLFSFGVISQLRWLDLTQTTSLKDLVAAGATYDSSTVHPSNLKDLTIKSTFFVPSPCLQNEEHTRSFLQAAFKTASTALSKTHWERYWLVTYRNGIEMSRQIYYGVSVLGKGIADACGCTRIAELKVTMSGTDCVYGTAQFDISGV